MNNTNKTIIKPYTRTEVVYEWRKFLGIFSYRVEAKTTEMFNTLFIESAQEFKHIILNGEVIK